MARILSFYLFFLKGKKNEKPLARINSLGRGGMSLFQMIVSSPFIAVLLIGVVAAPLSRRAGCTSSDRIRAGLVCPVVPVGGMSALRLQLRHGVYGGALFCTGKLVCRWLIILPIVVLFNW
jgi:hypothetical protein